MGNDKTSVSRLCGGGAFSLGFEGRAEVSQNSRQRNLPGGGSEYVQAQSASRWSLGAEEAKVWSSCLEKMAVQLVTGGG